MKEAQGERSLKCTKVANKSENKKKRKAPEKRIEGEVCVNGGWCGRFVIAVCLYLEECLYLEVYKS